MHLTLASCFWNKGGYLQGEHDETSCDARQAEPLDGA